ISFSTIWHPYLYHLQSVLRFADICAGPGGFSEYMLWRRCSGGPIISSSPASPTGSADSGDAGDSLVQNSSVSGATESQTLDRPALSAKGYGFTKTGNCDFRRHDLLAGPGEAFEAHYGPLKDGDITQWQNLASFALWIGQETGGHGVDLVMADGVSPSYSYLNHLYRPFAVQLFTSAH
ncbi:unnamed protein product, partial [Protopolystoma xenopodis]